MELVAPNIRELCKLKKILENILLLYSIFMIFYFYILQTECFCSPSESPQILRLVFELLREFKSLQQSDVCKFFDKSWPSTSIDNWNCEYHYPWDRSSMASDTLEEKYEVTVKIWRQMFVGRGVMGGWDGMRLVAALPRPSCHIDSVCGRKTNLFWGEKLDNASLCWHDDQAEVYVIHLHLNGIINQWFLRLSGGAHWKALRRDFITEIS